MSFTKLLSSWVFGSPRSLEHKENQKPVNITSDLKHIVVKHKKHNMLVKREADNDARIPEMFSRTSRPCPPFCIQPMAVESVETIGELEVLDYLSKTTDTETDVLIVDSRMENWVVKGTIPCSINIPWTDLTPNQGANTSGILSILKHSFNVSMADNIDVAKIDKALEKGTVTKLLDFSSAKTLVLFCNGTWCGQTSESIKSLIAFGYPADKIKYFRNGMQGWVDLGLTTISLQDEEVTQCRIGS